MTREFQLRLGLLLLFVSTAFWWLLLENDPHHAAPQPLHIAGLRQLAGQMPGRAPDRVEFEIAATAEKPADFSVAGGGLRKISLAATVFRLPVTGGAAVMIDSGPSAAAVAERGYDAHADAIRRVEAALASSRLLVLTEGRPLHATALLTMAAHPGKAQLLQRACLGPAQLADISAMPRKVWPAVALPTPCLTGQHPEAVAPGVVVIPAPGHAHGSQMVYVRLADGREFLFAGQNAPLDASWRQLRARGRIVADFRYYENRRAVFSWLLTIHQLAREAPGLIVVPGSDAQWLEAAAKQHLLSSGFSPDRP